MGYPAGFNFRATLAFVTDGTNDTYAGDPGFGPANVYPTTFPNGVTAGWEQDPGTPNIGGRDRNAGNPVRLAGIQFDNGGGAEEIWRMDLPAAGSYNIACAFGDPNYASTPNAAIKDNATTLQTLNATVGSANSFVDATNTVLTAAAWAAVTGARGNLFAATFSSTILRFVMQAPTKIAHVYAEVGGTPFPVTRSQILFAGRDVGVTLTSHVQGDFSQFPKNPIRSYAQGYQ